MIYVLGCDHDIQSSESVLSLAGEQDVKGQRDHFAQLLEQMLSGEKVDLVAEEWRRRSESFAEALARKHTVSYVNINTSFDDLDALQIPRDYTNPINYTADQRQGWLQQRERFMLDRIRTGMGTARSALVICGFYHMEPVAVQLGDDERVMSVDYRKEGWYRADVFFPVSS
jgi:hypothetical protein